MAGIIIGVDTSSAFTSVEKLTKSLGDLGKQGIVTESEIKKLTDEFKKKLAADDAARDAAKLGNTLDRVAKSCNMTASELHFLKIKAGVAASEMDKLGVHAATVSSTTEKATNNISGLNGVMSSVAGKIGVLAAGFLSLQTAMQAVTTVASMQAMKASFDGIFGDRGPEQFKYVMDAANKYGKSIDDVAGSYKKFAAAADFVGISTDNIRKIFEATTQAITKVGGTSQDVSGALLAISQSLGKGVVMSEEFKGQFAERIPGAMKIAADAMGVTTIEFQKMMESGQVMAVDFWPKIASGMENFSQGWQKSSDTMVSNFERVKNAMKDLAATDVAQGAGTFLGKFFSDSIIQRVNEVKEAFRYMSVMARTMNNMQTPELPQFSPVLYSIDELESKLAKLDERKSGYIKGLQEQVTSLSKTLVDLQTHQIDFGPSGENVEVMRQKLKWFQDLLLQLTGQTYTVNVTANVDTSQLKQAQSYIQEIIKGTAEVKSRTIAAESEKLDNAVKVLGKNKADLEAKLSNPNADLREKGGVAKQIEAINKDLDDAKLGYTELQKQQKQLTERQVKDNSEVKKFNESRGGVSGSEVTRDTQKMDAERLSVARQTDAWREYQAGLKTLPETYEVVTRAQEAETVAKDKITKAIEREGKARSGGANAAAKYAERTSSYLEQAEDQYNHLVAQMGGDSLGAKLAAIEKKYDKAASTIRQAMIGAKGSTAELTATLEVMGASKAIEQQMAQMDAWRKSMQAAANLMGELGRMSGDPQAVYGSEMTTAKLWESDQQARIAAIQDETEREKQLGELRRVMALKEVTARADAYAGIKAVSSEYWAAEKQLIEANLATVKAKAEDETAYKIYAAQQWDEFYKSKMEQQAATAGSFAETLAAKWSLAFGGYESETTKTKKRWDSMSESIVNSTNGMIDGIAGGFGDMIRNIGNGTASIEDLWKNMLSRMLDAFASFVEELVKTQLKDLVGGLFSGGKNDSSLGLSSLFGGSSSSGGGSDWSSITSLFKGFGKDAGAGMGEYFSSAGSSGATMVAGSKNALADIFSEGVDASKLGANIWKTTESAVPMAAQATAATTGLSAAGAATSMLSTVGSVLGGVGAVVGLIGMAASLFGEKKEEVKKTASGYNVGYNAGHATSYGVDFYSDGSVVPTGASDPAVQKKIADAFRNTAESLQDFAEELGFAVDVLDGFSMPSMNVSSDNLDNYINSGENMMAFKGLMEAGLRGAFDAVARDGEVYKDEYERLATSLKTVKGGFEAYGYELKDVAQISQADIDALRVKNTEVANGTADAMRNMATSMGATADVLAQITEESTHAAAALAVTDEQLSNILEADYASDLLDAVGGEDAFNTIMGNLTKNIFDSIGAYAENLDYYNEKAASAINKLGDASVAVDNFWIKFDEAIKGGLSVDQFEAWGKASSWVANINSVEEALSDWNDAMTKTSQSLDQRMAAAQGYDYQAKLAKQMADAEWELAAAREAGYDATMLARIQTVQAAELAATVAKHQDDYEAAVRDAAKRYATTMDDQSALIAIQIQENALELEELSKEFNWSVGSAEEGLFQALQKAQWAEVTAQLEAWAKAIADATASMTSDIAARRASLNGLDAEAEAIQKVAAYQQELTQAYEDGISQDLIDQLSQLQLDELADYWADVINDLKKELGDVGETIEDKLADILDRFTDYTDGQLTQAQTALSVAEQAANAYNSAADSIEDAMDSIRKDNAISDPREAYQNALANWQANFAKGMTGDTEALSNSGQLAQELISALKDYTPDSGVYQDIYASVMSQLGQLDTISTSLGIAGDYQVTLLEAQVELLTGINNELAQANPDTEALTNMVAGLGVVSDLLAGTRNVYITDDATAAPLYSVINELTGQTVQIGDLSLDQLYALKDYTAANVDATGEVSDATKSSNAYLKTQEGILLSGNATQDILRYFSAQNISVSQEIKNAIMGDSATANLYLGTVSSATTQMVSLLGQYLQVSSAQAAAQDRLVKQAQVAAAQSNAQTLYNQAISAVQNTQVGQLTAQLATTGAGYRALTDLSAHYGGSSLSQLQKIQSGQMSESQYIGWFLQNYGTGSGQVDWSNAISLMAQVGILPSNVASLMSQYQAAQQQYLALKAQYGFAVGGVVPGSSYTGDAVLAGLNSGERVLTADQNRTFERIAFQGGSDDMISELRAIKAENAALRSDVNKLLFAIVSNTGNISRKADDWNRRGVPTREADAI